MTSDETPPVTEEAATQPVPAAGPPAPRLRILISGGGTGGHIYPALAVAAELRERYDAEVLYIGDENGLETQLVPPTGLTMATVHAGKLRRYWSAGTVSDALRVPRGFLQARRIARAFAPDAAFTSGGYVAVPAGFAARRLGAPLLIHQQDVLPNLANRLLRPIATRITVSFEESLRYFPRRKTSLVGNPVRETIAALAGADPRAQKRALGFSPAFPLLVVTGGSQGALHLNQTVVEVLPALLERFQVLHVSGQATYEQTAIVARQKIARLADHVAARYRIEPYLDAEMPVALAAADAVLGRAGAATLAELAMLGKPGILVPLPPGVGGSPQEVNAAMFARHGAALTILDKDLSATTLLAGLTTLFADPDARLKMAQAARKLAHADAAARLATMVAELARAHLVDAARRAALDAPRPRTVTW